jgi:hypothetical protein
MLAVVEVQLAALLLVLVAQVAEEMVATTFL